MVWSYPYAGSHRSTLVDESLKNVRPGHDTRCRSCRTVDDTKHSRPTSGTQSVPLGHTAWRRKCWTPTCQGSRWRRPGDQESVRVASNNNGCFKRASMREALWTNPQTKRISVVSTKRGQKWPKITTRARRRTIRFSFDSRENRNAKRVVNIAPAKIHRGGGGTHFKQSLSSVVTQNCSSP